MQFTILSTFTTLALAAFVAAGSSPSDQCNTGSLQCCNSVQSAQETSVAHLLSLLGVAAQDVTAQVGVVCSPVTVVGAAGNSW